MSTNDVRLNPGGISLLDEMISELEINPEGNFRVFDGESVKPFTVWMHYEELVALDDEDGLLEHYKRVRKNLRDQRYS